MRHFIFDVTLFGWLDYITRDLKKGGITRKIVMDVHVDGSAIPMQWRRRVQGECHNEEGVQREQVHAHLMTLNDER